MYSSDPDGRLVPILRNILLPVDLSEVPTYLSPYLKAMGTHTRKGTDKVVCGSVADRVVKGAKVPVMAISPFIQAGAHAELMDPYV
jgi:hypothetical protein